MAALTNNYRTDDKAGDIVAYNCAASVTIWQGALLVITTSTGLTSPASDVAGVVFTGVAFDPVQNATGGAGANSGRVQKTGTFVYNFSGSATQATVGQKVYAVDDNTVALSTSHSVYVGEVVGLVSGGAVRVRIDRAVQ